MRLHPSLSKSLRHLLPNPTKHLILGILVLGSLTLGGLAAFLSMRGHQGPFGLLVPRQSTLTWQSPNAYGPIVAEHAELLFLLDNPGPTPVKVLHIDSSCDCAKPVADPSGSDLRLM